MGDQGSPSQAGSSSSPRTRNGIDIDGIAFFPSSSSCSSPNLSSRREAREERLLILTLIRPEAPSLQSNSWGEDLKNFWKKNVTERLSSLSTCPAFPIRREEISYLQIEQERSAPAPTPGAGEVRCRLCLQLCWRCTRLRGLPLIASHQIFSATAPTFPQ